MVNILLLAALAANPYLPPWEHVPDAEPRIFGDRLYVYGSHDRSGGCDFCLEDYVGWSATRTVPSGRRSSRHRGFTADRFPVAGADKQWYLADAVIDGADVVVSAKEVPAPVAVRYAFRANPMGDCNLYNREGLPASPFRTDDW